MASNRFANQTAKAYQTPPPLSVRFRPDRPRQPELMRRLEGIPTPPAPRSAGPREQRLPTRPAPRPPPKRDTEFEPYQLKPKRDDETFIEPLTEEQSNTSIDPKKLKRMKKKLDELNRKIRHSRKKHDGMIHKTNALRKAIEGLKHGTKPEPMPEPEWTFKEHEEAFNGVYRSYRVYGRPKMDVETFFNQIREKLIDLIKRELTVLNSARVQMTTWIRFIKDKD